MRDPVTCDHFLDALGDPGLAFKIRERQPADVDSALRIALQLEVWAKEITRHRDTEKGDSRRVRTILARKPNPAVEALQEEVEDLKKFVGFEYGAPRNPNGNAYASSYRQPEATRHTSPSAYSGVSSAPLRSRGPHHVNYGNRAESAQPSNGYGNRNGNFYRAPNPTPDALTVETRHIKLETVRSHPPYGDGPSSSRRRHHDNLHNSHPMSDL